MLCKLYTLYKQSRVYYREKNEPWVLHASQDGLPKIISNSKKTIQFFIERFNRFSLLYSSVNSIGWHFVKVKAFNLIKKNLDNDTPELYTECSIKFHFNLYLEQPIKQWYLILQQNFNPSHREIYTVNQTLKLVTFILSTMRSQRKILKFIIIFYHLVRCYSKNSVGFEKAFHAIKKKHDLFHSNRSLKFSRDGIKISYADFWKLSKQLRSHSSIEQCALHIMHTINWLLMAQCQSL